MMIMENQITCIGVSSLQHALGAAETFRCSFPVKCSDVLRDTQERSPLMQFHLASNETSKSVSAEQQVIQS